MPNVVWSPVNGTSQEFALTAPEDHILYCGTRGSGKTITQLMTFIKYVGQGYGQHLRGLVVDREYKHLADMVAQSKQFFPKFKVPCKFLSSASEYKWVWATGEELLFRHFKKREDYQSIHGQQFCIILFNELSKHPTPTLYDLICSTNRTGFLPEEHTPKNKDGTYKTKSGLPLPPIPLKVFSTTNPSGAGHSWIKNRFINPARYGETVKYEFEVFDPLTQEDVVFTKTQVALFGSYKENRYLPVKYVAELNRLTDNDPSLKAAWLQGSWDITTGGMFDDLWKREVHEVDRFPIPSGWKLDRTFDWGSSHPYGVIWWAISNGEEVELKDGSKVSYPKGSKIAIYELYGAVSLETNEGVRLTAKEIAQKIKSVEKALLEGGWISSSVSAGAADNQINNVNERDTDTIAKKMEDEGISWTKSDKSAGSRIQGVQLLREHLLNSLNGEENGIYFMRNCNGCIQTLPPLQRDEDNLEDIDTTQIDHLYDCVRYKLLDATPRGLKVKTRRLA